MKSGVWGSDHGSSLLFAGKRLLVMSAPALAQLGIRQHDHQKIHLAAIMEIQKYCNDMEYVPADQYYPDKLEDRERLNAHIEWENQNGVTVQLELADM